MRKLEVLGAAMIAAAVAMSVVPEGEVVAKNKRVLLLQSDGNGGVQLVEVDKPPGDAIPLMRVRGRNGYATHNYMENGWPVVEDSHYKETVQNWVVRRPDGSYMSLNLEAVGRE
tara:strand:- start:2737 stop:3078 length:342 start_codon:yes stop_codon:yes gene_type:complete